MQKQHFYSNGKLLISGEYLVLKGARALAIPLTFGQDLQIETKQIKSNPLLYWKSYENDLLWFELTLSLPSFELLETSDRLIADKLIHIFKTAFKQNAAFISEGHSYFVKSQMNFDRNWGLGSSSTLINNIANWAIIDPYFLLKESFGGSGYDIACASAENPIYFYLNQEKVEVETAGFNPIFSQNLYFVYLGKKQSSMESIKQFEMLDANLESYISEISEISVQMSRSKNLNDFQKLMRRHEEIISKVLNKKRIKKERFSDFTGEVKSLGGWGGDFVLVATDKNYESVKSYFKAKGLEVVFKYEEVALGYY